MSIQTKSPSQGLLFSEPSYSETAVWCELSEGVDPAEWAYLSRFLGKMSPEEFKNAKKRILGSPDTLWSRVKRLFKFEKRSSLAIPLVSLGPSGIGGEFQKEG